MCLCVCKCVCVCVYVWACVCLCVCVYVVMRFFWHPITRTKIINNASAVVMFCINSRQILVGFDANNGPAVMAGDAREVPEGWVLKIPKKTRPKVMPRGARFGALWDPLGVRRMLFGRKNGFMDVFFACFISSRCSVGVFIDF